MGKWKIAQWIWEIKRVQRVKIVARECTIPIEERRRSRSRLLQPSPSLFRVLFPAFLHLFPLPYQCKARNSGWFGESDQRKKTREKRNAQFASSFHLTTKSLREQLKQSQARLHSTFSICSKCWKLQKLRKPQLCLQWKRTIESCCDFKLGFKYFDRAVLSCSSRKDQFCEIIFTSAAWPTSWGPPCWWRDRKPTALGDYLRSTIIVIFQIFLFSFYLTWTFKIGQVNSEW